MRNNLFTAGSAGAALCAILALAGCGHHARHAAEIRPVAQPAAWPAARLAERAAAISPGRLPRATRPSEAVWGLRAGLNVAALSCRGRGRQPVASAYSRMLSRHRTLLAAAYRQEQARQSLAIFDRQQTRVYNTFANQHSPARFCTAASLVAQRANGLDSAALTVAAPRMLGELRASLR